MRNCIRTFILSCSLQVNSTKGLPVHFCIRHVDQKRQVLEANDHGLPGDVRKIPQLAHGRRDVRPLLKIGLLAF